MGAGKWIHAPFQAAVEALLRLLAVVADEVGRDDGENVSRNLILRGTASLLKYEIGPNTTVAIGGDLVILWVVPAKTYPAPDMTWTLASAAPVTIVTVPIIFGFFGGRRLAEKTIEEPIQDFVLANRQLDKLNIVQLSLSTPFSLNGMLHQIWIGHTIGIRGPATRDRDQLRRAAPHRIPPGVS